MPSDLGQPPYKVYRSGPRGLKERLRGEDEGLVPPPGGAGGDYNRYGGGRRGFRNPFRRGTPGERKKITPGRVLKWVLLAIVAWVLLSFVLFMISAQTRSGSLPSGASSQLSSGGPMLTSANTILLLGLDTRPKTGPGSKEPGANFNDANAATDTIMLWRLGGGTSRRLSIPRDTLVNIPGHGMQKINAAWPIGGPALALQTIKQFTGIQQINHLVVINLGNFPNFIDDVGGVTVTTGKICSNISGGAANGGFTLDLNPGTHHLNGLQAMVLARTRENSCNPASNDLTREAMQQQILNSIKSQLLTFHTFFHLPWAAWDAPGVLETDMGGLSLMQMFIASEIGGSAPVNLLKETPGTHNGADVLIPDRANVNAQVQKLLTGS
ncbi:MAG: LCP family protein [Solirubrobacterales bacterium]|nr:LCP family protein [Solirubrobacterales bacterium]